MKNFYAEWQAQDAILLAFPHEDSDWNPYLSEVRELYYKIIFEILQVESCILICKNRVETISLIKQYSSNNNLNLALLKNLYCIPLNSNDTWARDFGGITIKKGKKNLVLNYGFNGWGLKFPSNYDNLITQSLANLGAFKVKTKKIILEGGSIECNGDGILLTNTQCLLEKNRNPALSQKKLERILKKDLGVKKVLWLNSGFLSGDDTDSHIDPLARFVSSDTIVYTHCEDINDLHFKALNDLEDEIRALKNLKNKPFKCISLPLPSAKFYDNERLPATYANFLFINGAILLPIYNDKNDEIAIKTMQKICKNHKIIPIDCSILIRQHGSLHCISMQFPKNTINFNALKDFKSIV